MFTLTSGLIDTGYGITIMSKRIPKDLHNIIEEINEVDDREAQDIEEEMISPYPYEPDPENILINKELEWDREYESRESNKKKDKDS